MTDVTNCDGRDGSRWRMAAWATAAFLLLVPLVAGLPWTAGDYVFAAVLLFGSLGAYEVASRMSGNAAYRAGAGVAIAAVFLLLWSNGAVGITDSDADLFFMLVPAVAFVGAILARFRPVGMSRAMYAAALGTVSIAGVALLAGIVPAFNSMFEVLGIAGFFAILFVSSGLLFRSAAGGGVAGREAV